MSRTAKIIKLLISGAIIIAITLAVALTLNAGLEAYSNESAAALRLDAEYAAKEKAIRAEIAELLAASSNGDAEAAEKYYADLAYKEALEKQEAYYEYYTQNNHKNTAEGRDYHYYGQFYEMFNNVYNADTIFLGSSRSVYCINPLYLEENEALDEYSFYNFSLNAAGPGYYEQWYEVFKNEAKYPMPDTVIYCVDWFMFDDSDPNWPWMWRKFSYDTGYGGALYEIRKTVAATPAELSNAVEVTTTASEVTTEALITDELTTPPLTDEKKEYENFRELLVAWWNGEEKPELDFVADYFTKDVPLYAEQKRIPEMLSFYLGGGKAESQNELAAKRTALEIKYQNLVAERDQLKDGGKSEYPEVEIPNYLATREFRKDKDGNIASSFYKGFIPWEYQYHQSNTSGKRYNIDEVESGNMRQVVGRNEKEVEALKRLVRQMQADGINVIFLQVPDFAKHRPQEEIDYHTEFLESIAKELGVELYDYNSAESVVPCADYQKYFSNWNHMNERGAEEFSKFLAGELVEILK